MRSSQPRSRKRICHGEGLEVGHGVLGSAEREERLQPVFLASDPQLPPPFTGDPSDLAVLELRQRVTPPPQRQDRPRPAAKPLPAARPSAPAEPPPRVPRTG